MPSGPSNFQKDLDFRISQLAQQKAEAAALSTYRLYRTQLIERGMMALEADKAAREAAMGAAQAAYQQQMGRVQAIMNAPRGPADWAAYANRMRGMVQREELPGVLGTLALPGRTATFSNEGEAPPVPLTNSDFADAATLGLSDGSFSTPELVGPSWATDYLASPAWQAPNAFPAYYGNPVEAYRQPSGNPPITAPHNPGNPLNPPGYGGPPQQAGIQAMSAPTDARMAGQTEMWMNPAADLFGASEALMPDPVMSQSVAPQAIDPREMIRMAKQYRKAVMLAQKRGLPMPASPFAAQPAQKMDSGANLFGMPTPQQNEMYYNQPQTEYNQPQTEYTPSYSDANYNYYGYSQPPKGVSAQVMPSAYNERAAVTPVQSSPYSAQSTPEYGSYMSAYGGPAPRDPNQRGLYGYDLSYQRFRNLTPTEQELAVGYAEEGEGGFEPQSKDDFLSGMLRAAPNYAPAKTATWAGIR